MRSGELAQGFTQWRFGNLQGWRWDNLTVFWLHCLAVFAGKHFSFPAVWTSAVWAYACCFYPVCCWPLLSSPPAASQELLHGLLSWLHLLGLMSDHSTRLLRPLWTANQPLWVLTGPHNLVSSSHVGWLHPLALFRSLTEVLDSMACSTDPWGTKLVTCLQAEYDPLTTTFRVWSSKEFLPIFLFTHSN